MDIKKKGYFLTDQECLNYIDSTTNWIRSQAILTEQGRYYRQSPETDHNYDLEALFSRKALYAGSTGIAIYFIRLYQAMGKEAYLQEAKEVFTYCQNTYEGKAFYDFSKNPMSNAADAWNIEGFITGLYNGPAGSGILAEYLYKIEKDQKYRKFSMQVADDIIASAKEGETGIYWTDVSDLMSDGGLVLYLLYLYQETKQEAYLKAAVRAGDFILANAEEAPVGKRWQLLNLKELGFEKGRYFPGFSHGTAGIGYLFAVLYQFCKKEAFLQVASEAAAYITSLARGNEQALRIPYVDPPEEELYYLSVCHGPVGTAKLYRKLYELTGQEEYQEMVWKLTEGLLQMGAPFVHSKGYWNNQCFCCGAPGMLEHFLTLYETTEEEKYLALATETAALVAGDSYSKEDQRRWYIAWSRNAPQKVEAYTGLYVGAAGCASALLHLYAVKNGKQIMPYPEDLF